jgi:quinol monooxygenase YgiN
MFRLIKATTDEYGLRWYHWRRDTDGAKWTTYEGWFWRGESTPAVGA